MILRLTNEERNWVVLALNVLGEEYQKVSETFVSDRLRRGFETDATTINSLAGRAAGLAELLDTYSLNREVLNLMRSGAKIEAIKLVRANTTLGLKEAKDYAEEVERNNK